MNPTESSCVVDQYRKISKLIINLKIFNTSSSILIMSFLDWSRMRKLAQNLLLIYILTISLKKSQRTWNEKNRNSLFHYN